jgi:hypothetical protein
LDRKIDKVLPIYYIHLQKATADHQITKKSHKSNCNSLFLPSSTSHYRMQIVIGSKSEHEKLIGKTQDDFHSHENADLYIRCLFVHFDGTDLILR